MYVLSKIAGFFVVPSNFIILVGIGGALLLWTRFAGAGRRLMMTSVVLLAIAGLSPLGNILIFSLEQRFPPWDASEGAPHGIVVLGGAVTADIAAARNDVALNEAAERMTATVELARRYPNARIIFSGGDGSLVYGGNESDGALRLFEGLGLPPSRVELENQSRNTFENVLFSKRIAAPKPGERWLLVTSAYHVPRAMGMFRAAGFTVEPYPVDWRTRGVEDAWRPFPSLAEGLRRTDTAVREWAGLVIYWLSGRSSELFPGPSVGQ
jgi:uncharacterized SAM-binding protein YcdF (DUF218 family)